jgi:hypothetical protein
MNIITMALALYALARRITKNIEETATQLQIQEYYNYRKTNLYLVPRIMTLSILLSHCFFNSVTYRYGDIWCQQDYIMMNNNLILPGLRREVPQNLNLKAAGSRS